MLRRPRLPALLVAAACAAALAARAPARDATAVRVRERVTALVDSLDRDLARVGQVARDDTPAERRAAYRRARADYKHLEGALSYYAAPTAAWLGGAEIDGEDAPDTDVPVARAFARLEQLAFDDSTGDAPALAMESAAMRSVLARFRATVPFIDATRGEVLELARLEVARVATLGVAGFDARLSRDAMRESADALDGVRALVVAAAPAAESSSHQVIKSSDDLMTLVGARLAAAAAFLRATPDFDAFPRYDFVTRHANPTLDAIAAARRALAEPALSLRRVWPRDVASPYDARALDVHAYAPAGAPRATPELARLGAALFTDPRLSGDGTRSCASCHVPARGFTDGLAHGMPGRARLTPRLRYAAWQPAQLADARAATLEDQVDSVLANPAEMHSSTAAAASRVGREPPAVRAALAAYLRSLARFDTPFDRAMRGDSTALGRAERRGFDLFMGKAGCGTCHVAPLFNGTAPPDFVRSDVEVIGVPSAVDTMTIDADVGRAAIDRRTSHRHAFKTPTVRDAAAGGPYMHNASLRTLDDVIDFYDRGGGAGRGVPVPNQTLPARPLHLTTDERAALVAFLRSLTEPAP